jgi:hypothetical protein
MRSLALLSMLAIAALGGCASPGQPETWSVGENRSEGVKLTLGVPDTDDVRLIMTCQPRSGAVLLTVIGRQGDPAVVELHSGKIWNRYGGAGTADAEADGIVDIQFQLNADDPVLARVADTGELTIVLGERRMALPNGFAQAHDFLKACRRS